MCYFDVILLSDVISSIGPKISDAGTYVHEYRLPTFTALAAEFADVDVLQAQIRQHVFIPHLLTRHVAGKQNMRVLAWLFLRELCNNTLLSSISYCTINRTCASLHDSSSVNSATTHYSLVFLTAQLRGVLGGPVMSTIRS